MKDTSLADWIQIAATVAVVAGLVAVVFEIRQTKELAFSDYLDGSFGEEFENLRVVLGDSTAEALSKACFEPDTLTDEELIILDTYYTAILLRGQRTSVIENAAEFGLDVTPRLIEAVSKVGVSEVGRAWLKVESRTWPANVELVTNYLDENPIPECESFFPAFKAELGL